MALIVWAWEEKRPKGRWRRLNWKMDEQSAARLAQTTGVELRKIEGSREDRIDYSGRPMPPASYKPDAGSK